MNLQDFAPAASPFSQTPPAPPSHSAQVKPLEDVLLPPASPADTTTATTTTAPAAAAPPPAPAPADEGDPLGFDTILEILEGELNGAVTPPTPPAAATTTSDATGGGGGGVGSAGGVPISPAKEPLTKEGIEITVVLYVEILEAVVNALAQWWSQDGEAEFGFDKKLKARYERVTSLYLQTQSVTVSPGFLFGAFTVIMVGQVGFRAHRRRKEVIAARHFRQSLLKRQTETARPGRQMSMFPPPAGAEIGPGTGPDAPRGGMAVEVQPEGTDGSYYVSEADRARLDWQTDEAGYYIFASPRRYLKKQDRKQRPSPSVRAYIDEFKRINMAHPTNKQIKAYIQSTL